MTLTRIAKDHEVNRKKRSNLDKESIKAMQAVKESISNVDLQKDNTIEKKNIIREKDNTIREKENTIHEKEKIIREKENALHSSENRG